MSSTSAVAPTAPPRPGRAASRAVLGFVLRFVGGWAVVLALVAWVPGLEKSAVDHTVASLGATARLCRMPFEASGAFIEVGGASMSIVPDCTPLMPTAAFAIAVFAFPAAWVWRLGGFAAGAILLWLYNLARIFALVPVLEHRPEWFEFIHVYLWQTMTLLVVFAMFMVWLGLQNRSPRGAPGRVAAEPTGGRPTS